MGIGRSGTTTWLTALVALVALASCRKDAEPATYRYRLQINAGKAVSLPTGARVTVAGALMDAEGLVQVDRAVLLSDPATRAVAEYDTTCGPATIRLVPSIGREAEQSDRKLSRSAKDPGPYDVLASYEMDAASPPAPIHPVYVDNAGNTAPAMIRVGSLEKRVEAGKVMRFPVYVGSCAAGRDVSVDGQKVGEAVIDRATLVDVTGTHCYQSTVAVYGKVEVGAGPRPEDFFAQSTPARRMHVSPRASDVLEMPPDTAIVYGDDKATSRRGLQRATCPSDHRAPSTKKR